ncbi:MAG: alpha/beta hydrolase fold domain-containing protein, partial [Kiritimatiellae bacterium]|nr:alpha/beta hydrolase fold domain-containing protein [Kiritimatiellia bacterium]
MKFLSIVLAAAMLPFAGFADGNTQALWPTSGMPDAQAGVAAPYLEWSAAPAEKTGSCVIIVASGDYASTDSVQALLALEEKLLAKGVTCVWLHSRPSASGLAVYKVALEDAQRAVRLVRQAASERGYSADKIGVMGFSDGAHLSLLLAANSQTAAYSKVDSMDDIACNVNFAIPMSPTRVLESESDTTIDTVFAFDNKTCTMCLFHGQDDAVSSPLATTRIYRKLRTMTVLNGAKVPSEIHLIPGRGHDLVTASEFDRAVEFMCQSGFLGTLGAEVQLNSRFPNDDDRATYTKVSLWPEGKTPNYQSAQNEPYLEWHMPKELNTRAVQILYAGGAYGFNNPQDFEVTPLRRYLNAKGMAVVTIKYRCPRPEGLPKHMSAWQDLQRTIRLVRDEAPRRGLDPNSIGIMGCSAGGHLTLMGATTSQTAAYARIDEVDDLPCNVKWAIAIYPAYALTDGADGENTNGGNLDTDVLVNDFAFDASTCSMLFLHGDADSYAAMNSVKCWEKLRTMNIESELHTLATRRHTFQQNASPGTASYNINDIIWEYVDDFAAAAVAPEAVDGQPSGDQSGITDTKMIQDLIDAAAPTHGTVELSAGTFYVNTQLNVTNGVKLVGQGWTNTVIKQVATPNWNETARCAVLDGGAKIEGFALTGGYIKNANDCGAGVWVKNGTVSCCCITNNVGGHHYASGYGVSFSGGQGAIDHSIVANNVSASGFQGGTGAGIAVNETTGAVTIDTCLVVGNVTTNNGASGGGIYVKNIGGNCTVRNCTVVGNKAVANAGGIDIASASGSGKLVLVNSIVAGNKVGDAEGNMRTNTSFFDPVNSKNCFVGLASETKTNIGGVNYDLAGFKSGDPKFADPSNGDYRLQEDSPANGAGAIYDGIGNDLDGKAFAAPPSIGCYEYGVGEPPAPHTHDWGAPSYSWASDNSTCTATAVCTENSTHVTNETVTASYQVVQAATTEAAGTGRYTAIFSSALFSTQTKDVVIPQLNPGPGPEPADAIQPGASASANRLTIQD